MSAALNENLIREVVEEVLGRLSGKPESVKPKSAGADCGCNKNHDSSVSGKFGVCQDANSACEAAGEAFVKLQEGGLAARRKVVSIIKTLAEANATSFTPILKSHRL